jgi:hypothetical protein
LCNSGFTLNTNQLGCTDINECAVNNGNCSDLCVNEPGYYNCTVSTAEATQIDLTVLYYVLPIAVVISNAIFNVYPLDSYLVLHYSRCTNGSYSDTTHYQQEEKNQAI